MQKKTKLTLSSKIFSKSDRVTFHIAFVLSVFFIIYGLMEFHKGFYVSLRKMNEEPVALVTDTVKLTRRCFEKRTFWDILKKDSYIYNGDTIRTDENSQTTIVFFEDGLELTLTGNTMTRISLNANNQLDVFLDNGNILVDSVKNDISANIVYNNTRVGVQGKAMVSAAEIIENQSQKKLEVQVLDGKVEVTAKDTNPVEVVNGQMVTVTAEKDIVSTPVQIENNKDAHEFKLLTSENITPVAGLEKIERQNLFTTEYQEIGENAFSNDPVTESQSILLKLVNFINADEKDVDGEGTENVEKILPAISTGKPASGKVLNDEYFIQNQKIDFSWSTVSGATHYEFILYNPKGKVITKQTLNKNTFKFTQLEKLSNGKFTWSVKAVKKNSSGTYEDVSKLKKFSFTIKLGQISGDATTNETNYKVGRH